jgi:hypothetical protein
MERKNIWITDLPMPHLMHKSCCPERKTDGLLARHSKSQVAASQITGLPGPRGIRMSCFLCCELLLSSYVTIPAQHDEGHVPPVDDRRRPLAHGGDGSHEARIRPCRASLVSRRRRSRKFAITRRHGSHLMSINIDGELAGKEACTVPLLTATLFTVLFLHMQLF